MYFVLSTYRVLIELKGTYNYQLDLRDTDFRKLIGFESKVINDTEYGKILPDITRGVDERATLKPGNRNPESGIGN